MRTPSVLLLACALLAACAGSLPKAQKTETAETLFARAQTAVTERNYDEATKALDRIRDEFPFSKHAVDAELLRADLAYKQEKFQEAAAAYRAFEETHPTHPKASYAVYRRGLSQMRLSLPEDQDQTATRAALEAFQKLLQAYPGGEYEKEAREKIAEARGRLAAHELYVARYYVRKEKFDAALGRLTLLLRDYPDTPSKEEAQRLIATLTAKAGSPK